MGIEVFGGKGNGGLKIKFTYFPFKAGLKQKIVTNIYDTFDINQLLNDGMEMMTIGEAGFAVSDRVIGYHKIRIDFQEGAMIIEEV